MGWKGTVRSIEASLRAAEREAMRRQKELEREQKEYEKMQMAAKARHEVGAYEYYREALLSIHKECSAPVNWKKIAASKAPKKPVRLAKRENKMLLKADSYEPSFFDRLLKREAGKRKHLVDLVASAKKTDQSEHEKNLDRWRQDFKEWEELVEIAGSLLEGVGEAKIAAIKKLEPFSKIENLASSISFVLGEQGMVEATLQVHAKDIVPKEEKRLLKTGRVSRKQIPERKVNELFQDYVCGCVLRVANELFSIIPDDLVVINAEDRMLNTKTGHKENACVLSVCVSRDALKSINLSAVDPSDSINNFVHNMSFAKASGFEAVDRVHLDVQGLS